MDPVPISTEEDLEAAFASPLLLVFKHSLVGPITRASLADALG